MKNCRRTISRNKSSPPGQIGPPMRSLVRPTLEVYVVYILEAVYWWLALPLAPTLALALAKPFDHTTLALELRNAHQ